MPKVVSAQSHFAPRFTPTMVNSSNAAISEFKLLGSFTQEKESTVKATHHSFTNTSSSLFSTVSYEPVSKTLTNSIQTTEDSDLTQPTFKITRISKSLCDSRTLEFIHNEILIYEKLKNNPHIHSPQSVLQDPRCFYLIYPEKKNQKSLLQVTSKVKLFNEETAKELFKKMIQCVHECHHNNIVHRDIKLPSFYIEEGETFQVRLGDLRYSTVVSSPDQLISDRRGSPAYVPPEVIKGIPYNGAQADFWSLGIVLYVITCGTFPFNGSNPKELFQSILKDNLTLPEGLSSNLKSLLSIMLEKDPSRRATFKAISRHPWLQSSEREVVCEDQIVPEF